ncbi:MAG: ABC transporter permease [Hyphomicrobiales bacterium]|nr:ABC transporter permease [Hyphomicrobiales bacterium]
MTTYLLQRLMILIATLVLASVVIFAVLDILPGNAAQTMLGASATPQTVAALAHKLGLDQPAPLRYGEWISGLVRGNLGRSYAYHSSIAALISASLKISGPLALLAMVIAATVALVAGMAAAARHGKASDGAIMMASQIGLAVPNFWFGIMLVLVFAVNWRLLPSGGFPGWTPDPLRAFSALILPALALGLVQAAILTRVTRSALLDVLHEDYIRTARAKGLTPQAIIRRHALPNAMIPILTIMGLQLANLVAGAVVVENVFSLPGLGRLIFQSISNRDTPVVADCVLLLVAIVIGVNFLVDLACAMIDPRLRMQP